jgi:hypothetical protein
MARGSYVEPETALSTYRYLRIGLVAAVAVLTASVVLTRWTTGHEQDSVSAYYYTESHNIFVAALCAAGFGLIAYKGEAVTEDVLLNFAGFMAFVVALVPTARPSCPATESCGLWLPADVDNAVPIPNNLRALMIAVAVGYVLFVVVDAVHKHRGAPFYLGGARWWELGLRALGGAFVAFGVAVLFTHPKTFVDNAHGWAAVAMFVAMTGVVGHYAFWADVRRYRAVYALTAALMLVGVVWAVVSMATKGPVFWAEVLLIGSFAAFWITQTVDLWTDENKYSDDAAAMESS